MCLFQAEENFTQETFSIIYTDLKEIDTILSNQPTNVEIQVDMDTFQKTDY